MKKVLRHLITCRCADCLAMFPPDRFEPTWVDPEPSPEARKARGEIPIGHRDARAVAMVWVSPDGRLAADWPGLSGTLGARVDVEERHGSWVVVGTRDPALAALADPVPLSRLALERLNSRNMVAYGLAPESAADFVACPLHGRGLHALTCAHLAEARAPMDSVVLYDPDGAFPDLYCVDCYEAFRSGDVAVAIPICSYCQARALRHHRLVARVIYGA